MDAQHALVAEELTETLAARLALAEPFTWAQAHAAGVGAGLLRRAVRVGVLRHPLRSVYHHGALPDSLALRAQCLRLVVPQDAVVTDRTAGWLHGVPMILAPRDHETPPPLQVFCPPGNRLRNALTQSGERRLLSRDVTELEGLRVTTPLRTACDLGRLLHVDQALAALDALLRSDLVTREQISAELGRFKGYRGVVQLRELTPMADGRAQSPGESILRRRWLACGIPSPELQHQVAGPHGPYYLDLALPELRLAAEYDGAEFHDEQHRAHDEARRTWVREVLGWILVAVRGEHVTGTEQPVYGMLTRAHQAALARPAA